MNTEQINFSFIPAATINSASSRLRCYGLAKELQKLGFITNFNLSLVSQSHILIVQKIVNAQISEICKLFKDLGGLVIYDIDDYGELALGSLRSSPEVFSNFISSVSIVTVDTVFRKNHLSQDPQYKNIKNIWVVPDPVDYLENLEDIIKVYRNERAESFQGCWFGNAPNIYPAIPYLSCLSTSPNVSRVIAITNSEYVDQFKKSYPFIVTVPWTLDGFPSLMRQVDFCILAHDKSVAGSQKSNNKMLASIALGVVPFVSRTNSYEDTANELKIPELIVDSPQDLINRLVPSVFHDIRDKIFSAECKNQLLQNSPEAIARLFIGKLGDYIQNNISSNTTKYPIKLNLGSGNSPLSDYVNVDLAPERGGVTPDLVCDIKQLTAFNNDTVDEILSIHVVEHFWRWEVVDILKEWVRVLKPGGKLILETPNLISACEELLKDPTIASGPGQEGQRSMWCFYGDPVHQDPLMCHRWLYTPLSLEQIMLEAGLTHLQREPAQFKLKEPRDMRVVGFKPFS